MPTPARFAAAPAELDALKWRCIGPSRGGRVVAVAGDYDDPMTFYFGACAGGVWKTVDGGVYWRCVTDGYLTSATIGALAVARSDSNVVYAGTGETTIRLDVSFGDGLYRSTDAGRSWKHMGLRETRHIGRVVVHPGDPNLVYVAALGDAFGANEERGVYRSKDGGETWEKVLYRGPDAGCVDLSMDPNNPRILFAGMWEARRSFWSLRSGGPGSGLFRSTDGGDSWEEIKGNGFPDGMLGKVGVSVSGAKAGRVFALLEAEDDKIGLYRSEDYGASWTQVCRNRDLMHRPWYYTHVFACPVNADTVYVTNLQMWKSTDGGAGFKEITTPHGDNHDLWIDPQDPRRMVEGNDGGACVSFNGGESWSSIYNQLTAQFYRMDIDNEYPYRVYATQQDNTSICVPSASEWGVITLADCTYPGTGESGFVAVHPEDSDIVYVGAIGSSPGGAGALQRYDHGTRQVQLVNVWPEESTGIAPRDMRYRFAWTFPIIFSPHDSNTLYVGGNHVFRTRDEGMSWDEISPDLSRNDPDKQDYSGGPLTRDSAGAETYASCACVHESVHRQGEIWASTDDGLVHVTRDDGKTWENVTPPGMPELAYVGSVEVSALDADTVYVSATQYKLADYKPYLFRSTDGGRSWASITGDLPDGEITRVLRADPVRAGLLYIGTETGVFFSLDDGGTWSRMGGGFPVVPVYDLKLKGSDLVAATHGRSFWVLDDVSPLRMLADRAKPQLIAPRPTIRTKLAWSAGRGNLNGISYGPAFGIDGSTHLVERPDGSRVRHHLDVGENPPNGAIVYYWLPEGADGPVRLTVRDAAGTTVAGFASDDTAAAVARRPGTKPGLNRFVWDLKVAGPAKLDPALSPRKLKPLAGDGEPPAGPTVVPGAYRVELEVAGATLAAGFTVVPDPRLATSEADYTAQFNLLQSLNATLSILNEGVNRIRGLKRQLADLPQRLGGGRDALREQAAAIAGELSAVEGALVDVKRESPRDVLRNPAGLDDTLIDLINVASTADAAPTTQAHAVSAEIIGKVRAQIAALDGIVDGAIATLNAALAEAGIEYIGTGKAGG
ncbi:MAG: glycosyl hydrolase [Thalassobaculum sp.]|uniref:VPS10 domain-containing protein n=1 Tax=Thalassobaculum sp. TaxID=2022740 RepID=UPI0032EF6BCD